VTHLAWLRDWRESGESEGPDSCPFCLMEQIDALVPDLQRKVVKYPCKHGNPRLVNPENLLWLRVYGLIAPYHSWQGKQLGDQTSWIPLIHVEVLRLFCQELQLDFFTTFTKIQHIHEALWQTS
jgi:hypothetical protein